MFCQRADIQNLAIIVEILYYFQKNYKTDNKCQFLSVAYVSIDKNGNKMTLNVKSYITINVNTPTGASTNPKNFDLNKNLNMNLI